MASLFEAYITNLGKYNEGELVGETLKLDVYKRQNMYMRSPAAPAVSAKVNHGGRMPLTRQLRRRPAAAGP